MTKRFFSYGEQISGTNFFFNRDHLGSVREMTDNTGAIRARYDYDPYGRRTKVQGDLEAEFAFTGHYYHAQTALYLTLYRAYDSDTGRWLNQDPIGEAGGINLFAYVENNPVNEADETGLYGSPFHFFGTLISEISHGHILQAPFVAAESVMTDFRKGAQRPDSKDTHKHAMAGQTSCPLFESRDQAKAGTQQFVQDQLDQYAAAHKWWKPWSGAKYLGDAYHAVEDSYANGHLYQPWDGGYGFLHLPGPAHLRGDWLPSPANLFKMQSGANQVRSNGGLAP